MVDFIKVILISVLISICSSAFGYEVKKFERYDGDVYRINMRQDEIVMVNEDNFYIVIKGVNDYRCQPGMHCFWNGPFVMEGVFVSENIKQFSLTFDQKPLNVFAAYGYSASIINVVKNEYLYWIDLKVNQE